MFKTTLCYHAHPWAGQRRENSMTLTDTSDQCCACVIQNSFPMASVWNSAKWFSLSQKVNPWSVTTGNSSLWVSLEGIMSCTHNQLSAASLEHPSHSSLGAFPRLKAPESKAASGSRWAWCAGLSKAGAHTCSTWKERREWNLRLEQDEKEHEYNTHRCSVQIAPPEQVSFHFPDSPEAWMGCPGAAAPLWPRGYSCECEAGSASLPGSGETFVCSLLAASSYGDSVILWGSLTQGNHNEKAFLADSWATLTHITAHNTKIYHAFFSDLLSSRSKIRGICTVS